MSLKKNRKKTEKFESETEEEEETAQEKSLRLAKKYLQEIEEEGTKENSLFYLIILSLTKNDYVIKLFL